MKTLLRTSLLVFVIILGQNNDAFADSKDDIKAYFKENIVGNIYYLKVDVIKVAGGLTGTDASNVYQSGNILHRTGILVTPDPDYFINEIGRQKAADGKKDYVTHIERGTKIHIHDVEVKDQEMQIEFTARYGNFKADSLKDLTKFSDLLGLPPQTLRLKFNKGYSLEEAISTFELGFATNRAESTVPVVLGMDKSEIITNLGVPDVHVRLEDKEIMVYKTLKLILVDDKLVNAE